MSAEWGNSKLSDLIKIKHGFAFSGTHITEKKSVWQLVTPGNFRIGGGFKNGGKKFWVGDVPNDYILSGGDLIVTMTDLSKEGDTLGFSALVPDSGKWLHNQRIGLVNITRPDLISKDYLYFLLRTPEYRAEIMGSATGSTVKHTSPNRICNFNFRLPPLEEQKKICEILSGAEKLADCIAASNVILQSIAQTLFRSWFVNFDPIHAKAAGREPEDLSAEIAALFPSEFEESELGAIPKGWVIKSFGECLTSTIGGDWGSEIPKSESDIQAKIIRGTDIPALRTSNSDKVPTRHIKVSKFGQRQLRMGDLVIEVSGGSTDQSTGRSLRVTPSMLSHLGNSVAPTSFCRLFRPQAGFSELLALRLDYLYDSGAMWGYQVQSTGIANFQTQLFLEKEKFAVPPAPLLKKFSDLVSPMIENTFDERVVVLKNLRDELLPRLISGKIRIEEAEEALADVMPSTEKQVA